MKTKIKVITLIVLSAAILAIPSAAVFRGLRLIQIEKSLHTAHYPNSYSDPSAPSRPVIAEFPNRASCEAALKTLESKLNYSTAFLASEPITAAYRCDSEPDIEYIKVEDNKEQKYAKIKNGEILLDVAGFELTEKYADDHTVVLKEGRMIDYNKTSTEPMEILVTEGLGMNIGDFCYLAVNGLDDEFKQPVVKAKVVGIAEKGAFIPGNPLYCNKQVSIINMYSFIFEKEMIYTFDVSSYYTYEISPNDALSKDIKLFAQISFKDFLGEEEKKTIALNGGEIVTLNSISVTYGTTFNELLHVLPMYLWGVVLLALAYIILAAKKVVALIKTKR